MPVVGRFSNLIVGAAEEDVATRELMSAATMVQDDAKCARRIQVLYRGQGLDTTGTVRGEWPVARIKK